MSHFVWMCVAWPGLLFYCSWLQSLAKLTGIDPARPHSSVLLLLTECSHHIAFYSRSRSDGQKRLIKMISLSNIKTVARKKSWARKKRDEGTRHDIDDAKE